MNVVIDCLVDKGVIIFIGYEVYNVVYVSVVVVLMVINE